MSDKAWKAFERRLAAVFGGQRRGAHTSDGEHGKCDIIKPGWSIEAKLYTSPTYDVMLQAARQAERNREQPGDIPIAVVKRLRGKDENALVVIRLDVFQEYFVNQNGGENAGGVE